MIIRFITYVITDNKNKNKNIFSKLTIKTCEKRIKK